MAHPYERSARRLALKRKWYHEHQAAVRSQQSRYNEERHAWKYQKYHRVNLHLLEHLSIINAHRLEHPTYVLTPPLQPRFEKCPCHTCEKSRAAKKQTRWTPR
ncbi:MAG TPA: hypothetical protein VJN21_04395 [Candidatus Acidoferrales bacterium]|nr:hypothetical protein [Candidatus Acidoferrales bacterium]